MSYREVATIILHPADMGKGKRIKFEKGSRTDKILKKQLRAFRKKFGRDPGPNDPVFFDPTRVHRSRSRRLKLMRPYGRWRSISLPTLPMHI